MASRIEVCKRIAAGEINQTQAAKLLGISRQRMGQLYTRFKKTSAPPQKSGGMFGMGAPVKIAQTVKADALNPDPLATVFAEPSTPASAPVDLKAVMEPIGEAQDASFKQDVPPVDSSGGATPPPPPPKPDGGQGVDPEDASAGRELLKWVVKLASEGLSKWMFQLKNDDPRLKEMGDPNEFLKVSLKRNQDKAAPLGALTRGWWGLLIGGTIQAVKMAFMAPEVPGKVTPATVKDSAAPAPVATPYVAPEPVNNSEDAPKPGKRPTLAEKIAAGRAAGVL